MVNKDFEHLLCDIEYINSLGLLSDIVDMMKDIVLEDENMTTENKKKFLFLYMQYKGAHSSYIFQKSGAKRKKSLKERLRNLYR